jgi:threonine dehydratase
MELKDIEEARRRIESQVVYTPCPRCTWLEPVTGGPVFLKLENLQHSGSFKDRGALNKLLKLTDEERARGVIAASAGNHAQAVASHAQRLGVRATIVMPVSTPSIKVANTRSYGAEVILEGANYDAAFAKAKAVAAERGYVYIHAFDDPYVMAGQGTIGLELLEQIPDLDVVAIPVGGGGMMAGIAVAIKSIRPDVRIFGIESELVPSMKASLAAHRTVEVEGGQTLADGIAVRRVAADTLRIAERYLEDVVLVTEEEIAAAVLFLLEREKTVAEGAGAAAVAALLAGKIPGVRGKKVCAIIGGGNIDVTMLGKIIDRGLIKDGRMVRLHVRIPDRPGGLAEVAEVFARLKANIVDIEHERAFTHTLFSDVEILCTLETFGHAHVAQIKAALESIAHEIREL